MQIASSKINKQYIKKQSKLVESTQIILLFILYRLLYASEYVQKEFMSFYVVCMGTGCYSAAMM